MTFWHLDGGEPEAAQKRYIRAFRCLGPKISRNQGVIARDITAGQKGGWGLLQENQWLLKHIPAGTYRRNYARRLNNSIYRSLIDEALPMLKANKTLETALR
jgi:hypothetical protein